MEDQVDIIISRLGTIREAQEQVYNVTSTLFLLASFMKNILQEKGSYSEFVKFTQEKRQQLVQTLVNEKKNVKGNNVFKNVTSCLSFNFVYKPFYDTCFC